jgi:spermidine synthase
MLIEWSGLAAGACTTVVSRIPQPFVLTSADYVTLHFSVRGTQSQMDSRCPDALDLEYTRMMMSFLLFRPAPARILMLGLGGGSLAKFCHRHLPAADITVVEVNPNVIALREQFRVPADSPRFRVIQDDGADFVRRCRGRFDVLLADAYDPTGLPRRLGSRRHYVDCVAILAPAGLLVANLHLDSEHYARHVARLRRVFGEHTLLVENAEEGHGIAFASRAPLQVSGPPRWSAPGAVADGRERALLEASLARVLTAHTGTRA